MCLKADSSSAWFRNGEQLFEIHLIYDVRDVKIFIKEFPHKSDVTSKTHVQLLDSNAYLSYLNLTA